VALTISVPAKSPSVRGTDHFDSLRAQAAFSRRILRREGFKRLGMGKGVGGRFRLGCGR
jgi:hypothetical protein